MLRYVTEDAFVQALECRRRLAYAGDRRYARAEDAGAAAALVEEGQLVEALARCLHPSGSEIATGELDEALAETAEALAVPEVTLFRPALAHAGCLARPDILVKRGERIDMIEVASKSFDSRSPGLLGERGGVPAQWRPTLLKLAFQRWVASMALPGRTVQPHLLLPDHAKQAPASGLPGLFRLVAQEAGRPRIELAEPLPGPVTLARLPLSVVAADALIARVLDEELLGATAGAAGLGEEAQALARLLRSGHRARAVFGPHCKGCPYRVRPCELAAGQRSGFAECWTEALGWSQADLDQPHIFDLWCVPRQGEPLLASGMRRLAEVTEKRWQSLFGTRMKPRQRVQVDLARRSSPCLRVDPRLAEVVSGWRFPLSFIDFETARPAVPPFAGSRPYDIVAFQFSCHTLEEGGTLRHGEWIELRPGGSPNLAFVRALRAALQGSGTVLHYSHHELTVLREIAGQLEEAAPVEPDSVALLAWLRAIDGTGEEARRLRGGWDTFDMIQPLRQGLYYHRRMGGSNSLKDVLPAAMAASSFLRQAYSRSYTGTNFPEGIVFWRQETGASAPADPYQLLAAAAGPARGAAPIVCGSDAMAAYARLQLAAVSEADRRAVGAHLLRYCELDTLAMVMLYQHWSCD